MDFNAWVESQGFDVESLSAPQKAALQIAWRASQNDDRPTPPPEPAPASTPGPRQADDLDVIASRTRAENARRQRITELAAGFLAANPAIVDRIEPISRLAIDGNWDVQRAELEMLKASRLQGPHLHMPSAPQVTGEVLEAAVCRAGGLADIESHYSDRTLSAVDKKFRGGIGLHELIEGAARQNGLRDASVKHSLRSTLRAAFFEAPVPTPGASVGPSTISVSGILSNVGNKFLRDGFNAVEGVWRDIAAIRNFNDFKAHTTYAMTGDLTFKKVAPGGEIKHGTLGNETYTNQADTYGIVIGLDRRDVVNDDLGAFTSLNRKIGRGGAIGFNEIFWTAFLASHTTFWTTGRLNYDDGTDTAFGADGLTAAMILWDAKTDPDGKPLGTMPTILLVPPAHRMTARRLMVSSGTNKDTELGDTNVWAGKFKDVCSTYLANSAMGGGYSALAWYLLADPNDIPTIEAGFLNGMQMPTVESVDMDADRLGLVVRGYYDFGCAKQEYRGSYRFKGEA